MLRTTLACLLFFVIVAPAARAQVASPGEGIRLAMNETPPESRPGPEFTGPAPESAEASPASAPIIWKPPVDGAPAQRVAGGVRGNVALPQPTALVPEQLGLTSSPAPSLFWHLDGAPPYGVRLFFNLTDAISGDSVAEVELTRPDQGGIQRIRLAEHDIELAPERRYVWSVAVVSDMDERSRDRVTMGSIQRRNWPGGWNRNPTHFAALGYWYDALEMLSDSMEATPGDERSRSQRRSLLDQAELQIANE